MGPVWRGVENRYWVLNRGFLEIVEWRLVTYISGIFHMLLLLGKITEIINFLVKPFYQFLVALLLVLQLLQLGSYFLLQTFTNVFIFGTV